MHILVDAAYLLLIGLVAGFLAATPDVIELRVTDRQPVDKVELLAPGGRVYLAHRIDREKTTPESSAGGGRYIVVGVIGAVAGRSIFEALSLPNIGTVWRLVAGVAGAIVLLLLLRLVRR